MEGVCNGVFVSGVDLWCPRCFLCLPVSPGAAVQGKESEHVVNRARQQVRLSQQH